MAAAAHSFRWTGPYAGHSCCCLASVSLGFSALYGQRGERLLRIYLQAESADCYEQMSASATNHASQCRETGSGFVGHEWSAMAVLIVGLSVRGEYARPEGIES